MVDKVPRLRELRISRAVPVASEFMLDRRSDVPHLGVVGSIVVGGRAEVVWVCYGWKVARLVYMFHKCIARRG